MDREGIASYLKINRDTVERAFIHVGSRTPLCRKMQEDVCLPADYTHPHRSVTGIRCRCRVRIYLPDEACDVPVVDCSELPTNPGPAVTSAAQTIAAEVIRTDRLSVPL
jgi:hypothetical protein